MTGEQTDESRRLPSNNELADIFQTLADFLALDAQSNYKILAYEKAAAQFRAHPTSIAEMADRGELRELPGIGDAIEGKLNEYLAAGHVSALDEMAERYPVGLLDVMHLPGLGPKTARRLWESAGVSDIDSLRVACSDGRLRGLPGMGDKTIENIGRAIEQWEKRLAQSPESRRLLAEVEPQAARLVEFLRSLSAVTDAEYAGSLRRRRSMVRDIDLVAGSDDPGLVMELFAALPELAHIEERGDTKLVALTHTGLNVDLRIVPPTAYGNLLQHMTGSAAHNVALRGWAKERGFKVSEYDTERLESGQKFTFGTEREVYNLLGLDYVEPELRENTGELEASAAHTLPELIKRSDLKGDLHVHSDWSDGRATMEEMALAARDRGLSYICFCDHSHSLAVRGGITEDRLLMQIEEIRVLNRRIEGIQILCGTEVDILVDGRLDWPDEILARLDFVIASIHSGFGQNRGQIMERLLGAVRNPHVRAIGHPSGRLLTRREPYDIDLEQLARAAAETGTFLEINASCDRLDLSAEAARRAVELGATLMINSDSHRPGDFDNLLYGVWEARRGWLEPRHVANTREWSDYS